MEPTGIILGVNVAYRDARSALPDAPVAPTRPPRRGQTAPVRRGTAVALRRLADLIEPSAGYRRPTPC